MKSSAIISRPACAFAENRGCCYGITNVYIEEFVRPVSRNLRPGMQRIKCGFDIHSALNVQVIEFVDCSSSRRKPFLIGLVDPFPRSRHGCLLKKEKAKHKSVSQKRTGSKTRLNLLNDLESLSGVQSKPATDPFLDDIPV
jgi:hypothetical protein